MESPLVKLNNGIEIPLIGFGTWTLGTDEAASTVAYALKEVGYRHVDCAFAYGNEKEVGEGIRASGVPRNEIFITSKLWSTYHTRVEECLDKTLANLGTDYLDLYLVHWPIALNPNGNHPLFPTLPDGKRDVLYDWDQKDTWKQMEEIYKKGKVKAIGVSNSPEKMLAKILPTAEVIPAVNQLELHVYNPQHNLISYLRSKTILPSAYSPLGSTSAPLLKDETVTKIAKKHSTQPASVLIGYFVAKKIVVSPRSTNKQRIASNFTSALAVSKALDAVDIEELDGITAVGKQTRFIVPPWPVDLGFET